MDKETARRLSQDLTYSHDALTRMLTRSFPVEPGTSGHDLALIFIRDTVAATLLQVQKDVVGDE